MNHMELLSNRLRTATAVMTMCLAAVGCAASNDSAETNSESTPEELSSASVACTRFTATGGDQAEMKRMASAHCHGGEAKQQTPTEVHHYPCCYAPRDETYVTAEFCCT
jgi:hypothetical protein